METVEVIQGCLEKIEAIDYKANPRQAFLDFLNYNSNIKDQLYSIGAIKRVEDDIGSINWCINEILNFKSQEYDSYHQQNFESHKRRIRKNCEELIRNLNLLHNKDKL